MTIIFSTMESVLYPNKERYLPSTKVAEIEVINWRHFVEVLAELAIETYPSKDKAPLVSPAIYNKYKERKNINVLGWSFLALDVDGGDTFDGVEELLQTCQLNYVMYTTASHSEAQHKFRVFIEIDKNVMTEDLTDFWCGAYHLFGEISDAQCKDKSRGYYVPSDGPTFRMAYDYSQYPLTVDPVIELGIEHRPPVIQFGLVTSVSRFGISWTGLNDCVFVDPKWTAEYLMYAPGSDQHYGGIFKFMMRVARKAIGSGYAINSNELGALARQLDQSKDSRWTKSKRPFEREAQNAINMAMTG